MAFLKLLLSVFILIASTASSTTVTESPEVVDYILLENIKPMHYDIKLILINKDNFYGESNITLSITLATQYIQFHSHQVDINHDTISISDKAGNVVYKPSKYAYNFKSHVNTIYFEEILQPENYTLHIKFAGVIVDNDGNEEGLLRTLYINELRPIESDSWLLATYTRAIGARRVFPCWDEPAFKATFNISIRHPNNWVAFSNSPALRTHVDVGNMEWTYFNITPLIPSHIVWIMVLDVTSFNSAKTSVNNVTIFCEKYTCTFNLALAQSIIENVTMSLRNFKVEVSNAYHMIIPNYQHQIMENSVTAVYSKQDIMYNDKIDSTNRKIRVALSVALKTTTQWFANTISPSRWSYLWLQEALSTWVGTLLLNEMMPDLRIMDLFVVQSQHEIFHLDTATLLSSPLTVESNELSEIYSPIRSHYYAKASVIMRMLYHTISPKVFWDGLQRFINTHKFNSVTPDDLWTAMQSALNDSETAQFIDFDLKTAMNTWATEKNYPMLDVKQDYRTGYVEINILSENGIYSEPSQNWFIPITYVTRTNPYFKQIGLNQTKWLKPKSELILPPIPLDDWLIINVQQAGYYRVNYDKRNWRRLARYLKSCEYYKVHVLNRAQIVDDVFHFLMAGHLELSTFFEITQYLKQETDYIPWYPMIKAFEYMSGFLPYAENTTIKEHMRHLVSELLNNIKFEKRPDEDVLTVQLRQEAIKWACIFGDSQCKAASTDVNPSLEQLSEQQFSLGWSKWFHCKSFMALCANDWNKMISLWEKTQDSRILESLACSEDPDVICKHSNLFLSASYVRKIRSLDHTRIFFNIVVRHAKDENILQFVLTNFDKVKPRKVSTILTLTVIINYVYSKEQLNSIMKFAKDEVLEEQYFEVESKVKLRMYQIDNQRFHFQHLSKRRSIES